MNYEGELFEDLELDGEVLSELHFTDCRFIKCRFYELKVESCSFTDCSFERCTVLNAKLQYTDGKDNAFAHCTLVGVDWTELLRQGNATALPFERLEECTLKYNNFCRLKLKRFDFRGCDLTGSLFDDCDMTECRFGDAELAEASFTNNNLTGADFRGARNYFFAVDQNRLKKARFSFPEAISLLTAAGIKVE